MGRILAVTFFITLFISGCAEQMLYLRPKADAGATYKLGDQVTASTGSVMFSVFSLYKREAYRPRYKFTAYFPGIGDVSVQPTSVWIVRGVRSDGLINIVCPEIGWRAEIYITKEGMVQETFRDKEKLKDGYLFEKIDDVLDDAPYLNHFRADLIYNGISKNTIRVTYREYVKDMARPAFFQEMIYDLDESDTINFKSIHIRVIQATNSHIRFVVLDDQGLPWMPRK